MIDIEKILAELKSEDAFALARARALLRNYHIMWAKQWEQYDILRVEMEFEFALLNPDSEKASRSFAEAGTVDVLARHIPTGRIVVIEHKTTSDSIAPDSDYWNRLKMDTQVSKYYLSQAKDRVDVAGVLYDVVSKPGHRPAQIPVRDASGLKIVHDAAGNRVFTKDGKKPRETGDAEQGYTLLTRPETPDEFEARLNTAISADPGSYFAQREVPRLDSDILEYMEDAWATTQQILYFRRRNLWPRNPAACDQFGKCEFFDLCCGRASVDQIRYRKRERIHAERELQNFNGLELLTKSRTEALRKCSRYHQLRYEDGVERVDEVSEALRLGTLMHVGWQRYFSAIAQSNSNL